MSVRSSDSGGHSAQLHQQEPGHEDTELQRAPHGIHIHRQRLQRYLAFLACNTTMSTVISVLFESLVYCTYVVAQSEPRHVNSSPSHHNLSCSHDSGALPP